MMANTRITRQQLEINVFTSTQGNTRHTNQIGGRFRRRALSTINTDGRALATINTDERALLTINTDGRALLTINTDGRALSTIITDGRALQRPSVGDYYQ